jgi:hypothetical protein
MIPQLDLIVKGHQGKVGVDVEITPIPASLGIDHLHWGEEVKHG